MRLIDIDKIEINEKCIFSGKGIKDFLDAIPTAYDVDKVVERLEELKRCEESRAVKYDEAGKYDLMYIYDELVRAYKDIIRIVKLGGIKQQ